MQSWLKSLLGSGELTELPEELAKLLAQAKRDRKALRELLKRSETASKEIGGLAAPLEAMRFTAESLNSQMSVLQERATSLGGSVSRFELLEQREGELGKSQERLMETVERSVTAADRLEDRMGKLQSQMEAVSSAERLITDLLGPKGPLAAIRAKVEEAREESVGYGKEVSKLREDQAVVRAAQEGVVASYEDLRSKMESLDAGVDKANASVARVDKAMVDLTKAEELGARTERQLNALKTLSDHISGKIASVERQREAMDRTEAQARALTDLHWELEAKLKEARSQIKEVKSVHSSVENLREMNSKVAERSEELRAEQALVERDSKTLRAALAGLQEQMRRSTKRFELEQSTLEADGQRVMALRSDVTDLETRFRELEEAGQTVTEVSRKVEEMSARTTSLSGELGRLSEQVELVEGMREGMSEARRAAVDVAASLSSIEARQSEVRDAVNDLRTLRGAQEEVAGAMENVRDSRSEIEGIQTGQAKTAAWLAETHKSVGELRANVAHLDDLTANVDHMREMADRVLAAASHLDERGESFEELEVRMSELRQIGTQLDERTTNLLSGLEDADHRFKAVARNADKADAARVAIEALMAAVQQAERRMAELGEGVRRSSAPRLSLYFPSAPTASWPISGSGSTLCRRRRSSSRVYRLFGRKRPRWSNPWRIRSGY